MDISYQYTNIFVSEALDGFDVISMNTENCFDIGDIGGTVVTAKETNKKIM